MIIEGGLHIGSGNNYGSAIKSAESALEELDTPVLMLKPSLISHDYDFYYSDGLEPNIKKDIDTVIQNLNIDPHIIKKPNNWQEIMNIIYEASHINRDFILVCLPDADKYIVKIYLVRRNLPKGELTGISKE